MSTDIYRSQAKERIDGKPIMPLAYILGGSLIVPQTRTLCVQLLTSIAMHVSKPGALAQGATLFTDPLW